MDPKPTLRTRRLFCSRSANHAHSGARRNCNQIPRLPMNVAKIPLESSRIPESGFGRVSCRRTGAGNGQRGDEQSAHMVCSAFCGRSERLVLPLGNRPGNRRMGSRPDARAECGGLQGRRLKRVRRRVGDRATSSREGGRNPSGTGRSRKRGRKQASSKRSSNCFTNRFTNW